MIVYDRLWATMKTKGISTYTLRHKYKISNSTVQRLRHNKHVSTRTLDDFCKLLDCRLDEIVEYKKDEE